MNGCPDSGCFEPSSRPAWLVCLMLAGLPALGCALNPDPKQLYEGAPLPKEQVGIVRSGCAAGPGLSIMATQIDGKDIADGCADFALLPGEHRIELSARQLAPKVEASPIGSASALGALPTPMGARPEQGSRVIWASRSPLRIVCALRAGQEVTIVGSRGMGDEWQAQCRERTR